MPTEAAGPQTPAPISLYAAVKAAIAEGFPLAEVLAIEDLDQPTWRAVELHWVPKIASGEAMDAYKRELASAEDALRRAVRPLDDQPEAWVAFLDAFAASADPLTLLDSLGLNMNDLSRLCRAWDARVAEDRDLGKRLTKLQDKHPPLPLVQVDPAVLTPSRRGAQASMTPKPQSSGPVTHVPTAELGLEIYAMICAHMEARPDDAETLRRLGVATPETRQALHAKWDKVFARDPTLRRDFKLLLGHEKRRLSSLGAARPASSAPSPSPARASQAPPERPSPAPLVGVAPQPTPRCEARASSQRRRFEHVLPFAPAFAPPGVERLVLSVEQYASFIVELGLLPEFEPEVLARYGLTSTQKEEHDAYYGAHIAQHPELRERLARACEDYRAWLASGAAR